MNSWKLISVFLRSLCFLRKNDESESRLNLMFKVLANNETDIVRPKTLTIKGRNVSFAKTCGGVLDSTFDELCNQPLGAIDYLTITQAFHTVIVRDVPKMSVRVRVQARRFITMIDSKSFWGLFQFDNLISIVI